VTAPAPEARASAPDDDARRDALSSRLFEALLGTFDLLSVQLGIELGLYAALRDHGPSTPPELATHAGIDARYAREWLEQQAVTQLLDVDNLAAEPDERRFSLPAGHAAVLLEPDDLSTMIPVAQATHSVVEAWPALLAAYRTGGGIHWNVYPRISEVQEAANRPLFRHLLAQEWLPSIPDVDARLRAGDVRVADVACGGGWSTIAIARAYPAAEVHGLDLDAEAIARARTKARAEGLEDRAQFHVVDAEDHSLDGTFDLVTIFEALHDLSRPVAVLEACRRLLAPGGTVLVMDEKVAEQFTVPGDEIERLMYGYSVFVCLPNGLAESPSAATGTVMRPDTVRRYAADAGFASTTILPIEHEVFRFYRLDP
jgi:2-polyprenyl-3-methyl-5-hydroxy-6-metoxy-1,4-benzoquinol methylase